MALEAKLQDLQSVLSGDASINFRDDPDFRANTIRWSEYSAPDPGAVVNVATETDVQKTVGGIHYGHLQLHNGDGQSTSY